MTATACGRVIVDWDHHDPEASHSRPAFVAKTLEHPIVSTDDAYTVYAWATIPARTGG
jgi:hypothetical protein